MSLREKRVLVIDSAGFIDSHIAEQLTQTDVAEILVYNSFFRGRRENLRAAVKDPRVSIFPHGGDILPTNILDRAMESIDRVQRRLFDQNVCLYESLDSTAIRALVNDHLEGRENRPPLIWSLLTVERWDERFLG